MWRFKVIRISESVSDFACGSGILCFGIRYSALGILNIANVWKFWNQSFTAVDSGIYSVEFRIQDCLVFP